MPRGSRTIAQCCNEVGSNSVGRRIFGPFWSILGRGTLRRVPPVRRGNGNSRTYGRDCRPIPGLNRSRLIMARAPGTFKKSDATPLDPALVKLIDALARSLAREDDAHERPATGHATPPATTGESSQP
jgi:hypothetical protein